MSAQAPPPPGNESSEQGIRLTKAFLIVLLGSLGIAALLGVIALVGGDLGETEARILVSTLAFAVFSGTGLASAVRLDRRLYRWVGVAGIGASLVALLLSLIGIWSEPSDEYFWRPWAAFSITALLLGYGSLVLLIRPRQRAASLLLGGTVVCLALVWVLAMVLTWVEFQGESGETIGRLLGALGILTVFGTLATPILNRVLRS